MPIIVSADQKFRRVYYFEDRPCMARHDTTWLLFIVVVQSERFIFGPTENCAVFEGQWPNGACGVIHRKVLGVIHPVKVQLETIHGPLVGPDDYCQNFHLFLGRRIYILFSKIKCYNFFVKPIRFFFATGRAPPDLSDARIFKREFWPKPKPNHLQPRCIKQWPGQSRVHTHIPRQAACSTLLPRLPTR